MENIETTYACSPFTLPGADLGARSTGTRTAFGHEGGVRVLAPVVAPAQGTTLSIAMRNRTDVPTQAAAKATALLPINVVVDFDGDAGIRSWSPPV